MASVREAVREAVAAPSMRAVGWVTHGAGGVARHCDVLARRGALSHPAVLLATLTSPTPSDFKPTAGSLPGGAALLHLVDGLGGWALMLSLAGLVLGAALWALGAHSQNYQQSYVGRRAVLVSGLAALLIGAAPTLINFFFSTGRGIVSPLPQ